MRAPADERLSAERGAPGERHDRLISEYQLVPGQRLAQAGFDLDARAELLTQAEVEQLQAATALGLGPVHRHIGFAQHVFGIGLRIARYRHADAGEHRQLGRAEGKGPLEGVEHALGQRHGLALALDVLGEDHELIAAQTRNRVAVAHQLCEPVRYRDQQLIPDLVPRPRY